MTLYLCDVNVWIALFISGHQHHEAALAWFGRLVEERSVLFCRATQQSFLRLVTQSSVMATHGDPALTNQQAWESFDTILTDDRITLYVEEPAELEVVWRIYTDRRTASPKLWMDAYLAAFAKAGGLTLVTTDTAFRQFDGIDLMILGAA